jgi:hypothetical protein
MSSCIIPEIASVAETEDKDEFSRNGATRGFIAHGKNARWAIALESYDLPHCLNRSGTTVL